MEKQGFNHKITIFETNNPQENNMNALETSNSRFICLKCQKHFSSASNLKQHSNVHINSLTREKFTCLIKQCNKSYLYICTLKKHIQSFHRKEYETILNDFIGNERNFQAIYNHLLEHSGTYDFIEIKPSKFFSIKRIESIQKKDCSKNKRFNQENHKGLPNLSMNNREIEGNNLKYVNKNDYVKDNNSLNLANNNGCLNLYNTLDMNNHCMLNSNNINSISSNYNQVSLFFQNNPSYYSYFTNTLYRNLLWKLYNSVMNHSSDLTL